MRQKLRTGEFGKDGCLSPVPISLFFHGNGVSDFQQYSWLYRRKTAPPRLPGNWIRSCEWILAKEKWMKVSWGSFWEPSLKGSWHASFAFLLFVLENGMQTQWLESKQRSILDHEITLGRDITNKRATFWGRLGLSSLRTAKLIQVSELRRGRRTNLFPD